MGNQDDFLSSKESFVKHVWNLRKLKSFEIQVQPSVSKNLEWILAKLDGMDALFKRLETLSLDLGIRSDELQKIFHNKRFFSHLTRLKLTLGLEPVFVEIPSICKKLNSLSFRCQIGIDERPEFRSFLTSIQQLTQLKSLYFAEPGDGKNFWGHFKPQTSLQHLKLLVNPESLITAGIFDEDKLKEIVAHWEEIKELKTLEIGFSCSDFDEVRLVRAFTTSVMKKVQKLKALDIWFATHSGSSECQMTCEPFLVEDVSHLYESLEHLWYHFESWTDDRFVPFVIGQTLKPFRNLKSLSLLREGMIPQGIFEEIVSFFEENQKGGEPPTLLLNLKMPNDFAPEELRNVLKVIEEAKRKDKSLEVVFELKFVLEEGYLQMLERLCHDIQSVGRIKGVKISVSFEDKFDRSQFPVDKVREISVNCRGVWCLEVVLSNYNGDIKFMKRLGAKITII